jgi:hypothetical protein
MTQMIIGGSIVTLVLFVSVAYGTGSWKYALGYTATVLSLVVGLSLVMF